MRLLTSFRPRSLRAQLIAALLPVTVLAVIALTWVAVSRATGAQRAGAHRELVQQASREANAFDSDARAATTIGRTIAHEMQGYRGGNRQDVSGMLHAILLANPRVAGTYVVYEPNAFDGRDASLPSKTGTNAENGRFAPYWTG